MDLKIDIERKDSEIVVASKIYVGYPRFLSPLGTSRNSIEMWNAAANWEGGGLVFVVVQMDIRHRCQ